MGAPRHSRPLDRVRAARGPRQTGRRLPARRLPDGYGPILLVFPRFDASRRAIDNRRKDGLSPWSYHGANEVIESYGIMGPVKAALESAVRYLAVELGSTASASIRISPGPLAARAASGIPDFDPLMERVAERAPVRRLVTIEEVGAACVFLASLYAGAITGDTI